MAFKLEDILHGQIALKSRDSIIRQELSLVYAVNAIAGFNFYHTLASFAAIKYGGVTAIAELQLRC